METNLEIEYKTILTKEEYLMLRKERFRGDIIKQVNTYFDNVNHDLLRARIMMRIRRIEETMDEFTIKVEAQKNVMEYSFTQEKIEITHPNITDFLSKHGFHGPFHKIAASTTYRIIDRDDFGEWALDRSFHGHTEDFELEYEVFEDSVETKERYLNLLKTYNITYKKSLPKFIRSIKAHQDELDQLLEE